MRLQLKRNGDTITILIEPKYALVLKENGYTEWYSIRRKPHFLKHHLSLILFSEKSSDKLVDVKPFLLWSSHWFVSFSLFVIDNTHCLSSILCLIDPLSHLASFRVYVAKEVCNIFSRWF